MFRIPNEAAQSPMKQIKKIWNAFYHSLPVQLLIVQVRYHKFELLCWGFLFLTVSSNFGEMVGVPFLFLEPEFLGKAGFNSLFLLGIGFGTFISSYNIASYISDSHRFYFITQEHRPFLTFFLNNNLLPFAFTLTYTYCYISFRIWEMGAFHWEIIGELAGFFLGALMVVVFIFLYFFGTNKNFVHKLGSKVVKEMKGGRVILQRARAGMGMQIKVDYMLSGFLKVKKVDPAVHRDFRSLVRTLNQNHGNALFLEFLILVAIASLGLLDHNPYFQIPAGTTIYLLLAVVLMLAAAMTFWFRKLGPIIFFVGMLGYLFLSNLELVQDRHPALGMDYRAGPAAYTQEHLRQVSSAEHIKTDLDITEAILNRWKADHYLYHPAHTKPKAVILCTSGGGLRSAYFTVRVMQHLDSLSSSLLPGVVPAAQPGHSRFHPAPGICGPHGRRLTESGSCQIGDRAIPAQTLGEGRRRPLQR